MTGLVQIEGDPRSGQFRVFCNVCNRLVDKYSIETPLRETVSRGMIGYEHTGEVIIAVECHGVSMTVSSWRGRL